MQNIINVSLFRQNGWYLGALFVSWLFFFFMLYSIIQRRRSLKKNKEINSSNTSNTNYSTDILGMEQQIDIDTDNYQTIGKVLDWRVVLLIISMAVGLYLITPSQPEPFSDTMPTNLEIRNNSNIE
jgi:hypothetical protein